MGDSAYSVISVLWFICYIGLVGSKPTYVFQYPCHTDICTFPKQYCSSLTKRCQLCEFECSKPDGSRPLGCNAFCFQELTPVVDTPWINNLAWFIVSICAMVLLLAICITYSVLRYKDIISFSFKRSRTENETEEDNSTDNSQSDEESNHPFTDKDKDCDAKKLKQISPTDNTEPYLVTSAEGRDSLGSVKETNSTILKQA